MNNNIKRAEKLIDCFNKNNPNVCTCCIPATTTTVTVGTTTTTAPGTNASVTNVGTRTNAILNFSIPQGEPGTATNTAYSSIYSTTQTVINLNQGTATTVTLGTTGVNYNVNNETANKLTITNAGDYKIDYFLAATSSAAATLTLDVKNSGNQIVGSNISEAVGANEAVQIQGSVLANLAVGNVLELNVASSVNSNLTPSDGTNAYLIITKLN